MTNSDVLRRLRYTFDLGDQQVIDLFALGGLQVTRATISSLMKREDDPDFQLCSDEQLAAFLNGLIVHKRGHQPGQEGPPPLEQELGNNAILRKLRIALELREPAMLQIMSLGGMTVSRPELSALFRKPDNRHYRECQDQLLRNFLRGLQHRLRGSPERQD